MTMTLTMTSDQDPGEIKDDIESCVFVIINVLSMI